MNYEYIVIGIIGLFALFVIVRRVYRFLNGKKKICCDTCSRSSGSCSTDVNNSENGGNNEER